MKRAHHRQTETEDAADSLEARQKPDSETTQTIGWLFALVVGKWPWRSRRNVVNTDDDSDDNTDDYDL